MCFCVHTLMSGRFISSASDSFLIIILDFTSNFLFYLTEFTFKYILLFIFLLSEMLLLLVVRFLPPSTSRPPSSSSCTLTPCGRVIRPFLRRAPEADGLFLLRRLRIKTRRLVSARSPQALCINPEESWTSLFAESLPRCKTFSRKTKEIKFCCPEN